MSDTPYRDIKPTPKEKRSGKTRALAALIPNVARKAVGKRGFVDARILNDWPQIVGEDLSRHAHPDRLRYPPGRRDSGVLTIRAMGPMATELAHLEAVVVDRINAHFGYRAVASIKILQAPPTRLPMGVKKAPRRAKPPADPARLASMRERLEDVEDPELRAILDRLGEAILRREKDD